MRLCVLVLASLPALIAADWPATGPEAGSLLVVGGGTLPDSIVKKFIELAGGPGSPIVIIPTAGDSDTYSTDWGGGNFLRKAGCKDITVLHTRSRAEADSDEFTAPLRRARGVWMPGGRHWRFVDSYLHTRTQRELENLLARGGVIGGSSAGATIQGSYMVRGAREGNTIMMAPGYEIGFGYLRNVTIDQHLIRRHRENDLPAVIAAHPELLGIGIDESTAIAVRGSQFEVIGSSKVAIYEPGKSYYFLSAGDRFDLTARKRMPR